jgi:hypothetical protein
MYRLPTGLVVLQGKRATQITNDLIHSLKNPVIPVLAYEKLPPLLRSASCHTLFHFKGVIPPVDANLWAHSVSTICLDNSLTVIMAIEGPIPNTILDSIDLIHRIR